MNRKEMYNKAVEVIRNAKEKDGFVNPWESYSFNEKDNYILKADIDAINRLKLTHIIKRIDWGRKEENGFENQIPVPINGNFYKAKYLLLYSNPASEKTKLSKTLSEYDRLLKCFKLEEDAELVIPKDNIQWVKWYIGELDKFFNRLRNDNTKFNINSFLEYFCFLNLSAYPTKSNEFDYSSKELDELLKLESTKFIKKLVELAIKAGKEILIMRRSEGVWKVPKSSKNEFYLFEKLDSYVGDL